MSARTNDVLKNNRAKGIAAMQLVRRTKDGYEVTPPGIRGQCVTYRVTRGAEGKPVCSCLDFEIQSASEPDYQCEHLLAVKHAVKHNQVQEEEKTQAPATRFPLDPLARNLASLVTTNQLTMIKQRARVAGVDQDEECMRVMKCKTLDLSREAAEALIAHLEEIAPVEERLSSAAS